MPGKDAQRNAMSQETLESPAWPHACPHGAVKPADSLCQACALGLYLFPTKLLRLHQHSLWCLPQGVPVPVGAGGTVVSVNRSHVDLGNPVPQEGAEVEL